MLSAAPKHWFSRDFTIVGEGFEPLLLDLSRWRESAELEIDGELYKLTRKTLRSGDFTLHSANDLLARARKPSIWRSRFEIEAEGSAFELQRTSIWGRGFTVHRDGQPAGTVRPASLFTRRALVDLPTDWPLPLQIFILWLTLVIWQRDQAASS